MVVGVRDCLDWNPRRDDTLHGFFRVESGNSKFATNLLIHDIYPPTRTYVDVDIDCRWSWS